MGDSHPPLRDLERFVLDDLDPRESGRVLTHLARGCDRCRKTTAELWKVGSGEPVPGRLSSRFEQGEAVDRVLARIRQARADLETERTGARRLLAELESASHERRIARIQEDPRFHTRGFSATLLDIASLLIAGKASRLWALTLALLRPPSRERAGR